MLILILIKNVPTEVKGVSALRSEYGENNDKHVLFIHGLGASSVSWRDIPDALSKHVHTITLDLVGFGGSSKPENADYYTINGFSKFIVDFLDAIKIRDKPHNKISIVGHSLGGYIAAQVATENREMIEKLVLIDSSGLLKGPTPLLEQYRDAATEVEPILRYIKLKRVLGSLYANPWLMPDLVIDLFIGTIIKPGAKFAFEQTFENSTRTCIEKNGFNIIQDIPCLIIWGQEDNLIPIGYAKEFKKVFNKSTDSFNPIDDAGHAPFVEKTALVYEKLRTFLT
jgi:pimeloyl-ACP methyl ester carboxylesterase